MMKWKRLPEGIIREDADSVLETKGFRFTIHCQRVFPSGKKTYRLWGSLKTDYPYKEYEITLAQFTSNCIEEAEKCAESILKERYLNAEFKELFD